MAERFKASVLKTDVRFCVPWVRILLCPPFQYIDIYVFHNTFIPFLYFSEFLMAQKTIAIVCRLNNHFLLNYKYDVIIAVDQGADDLLKRNIKFDIAIGDFDSFSGDITKLEENINIKLFILKKEKDDTDLESAVNFVKENYTNYNIEIFADGSRVEHLISQINIIKKYNTCITLFTENSKIFKLSSGNHIIEYSPQYKYISFYTEETNTVSIQDLKYTINNKKIDKYNNMCISNEFLDNKIDGKIQISKDILVLLTKDDS